MYNVTFLNILLGKGGRLKKLDVDVSQKKQLHPIVWLQPLLPFYPTWASHHHSSYSGEVGKWILLSPNYSAHQLPPDFEDPGCLGNITGCCCGNSASLTTGLPGRQARRWELSTFVLPGGWR